MPSSAVAPLEEACADLVNGCCAVVFDGPMAALTFETRSQTGRGVSEPTVEKSIKGAKDAFVETLRVNTSLVRRQTALALAETGGAHPGPREQIPPWPCCMWRAWPKDATVQELLRRLRSIDNGRGLLSAAEIEEALADSPKTPFPQLLHTGALGRLRHAAAERPRGRYRGRPRRWASSPRAACRPSCACRRTARHTSAVSSMLLALRWVALALSLLLPGGPLWPCPCTTRRCSPPSC